MNRFIKDLRILPRWIIVIIDLGFFLLAVVTGYLLRFNFDLVLISESNIRTGVLLYVFAGLVSTLITKSYSGIIRYTGWQDALRVLLTVTFTFFICSITNLTNGVYLIPFSVLLIAFMASLVFLINYRVAVKYIFTYYSRVRSLIDNVLIFGAGETGQNVKQVLDNSSGFKNRVVGFIEDDRNKVGKNIDGAEIFDGSKDLKNLLQSLQIGTLIISVNDLSSSRKNELVNTAISIGTKVKHVPPAYKWVDGQLQPNQIRDIEIEDLLGRDIIRLDNYYISQELAGKRILITGAAGSIGSEITRQVLLYNPESVLLIDQWESGLFNLLNEFESESDLIQSQVADISKQDRIKVIFREFRPQIVFHAAAYKHVPLMENNPVEAIACNVGGTKVVADFSKEFGVKKFVMISTDKAVNPTNVMGASKRIAEKYIQSLDQLNQTLQGTTNTKFITTRFGNVLGSNGSVIPVFEKQIKGGGPVTVTHPDITRYFMTIPEACQLVLEAGAMGKGGEVFIFDMGKSVKISDMARKMIQLSGLEEGKDIDLIYTGLREGEKLHEELLLDKEKDQPTYNHKIKIAEVEEVSYFKVQRQVDQLLQLCVEGNSFELVDQMKLIVPEFRSNASRYERLDVRT